MSRKYQGKGSLSKIMAIDTRDNLVLEIQVAKEKINYVERIFEGYENTAILIPLEPRQGILRILTTRDLLSQVMDTLLNLKLEIKILKGPSG